jgi:ABC-type uncharacterized transport system fused permease/ATPase subunit
MSISRPIALVFHREWLMSRFWQSASQCWQQQKARAIGLAVFLVVLVLLQLLVQLFLNLWNRNFFDALGRKDVSAKRALLRDSSRRSTALLIPMQNTVPDLFGGFGKPK